MSALIIPVSDGLPAELPPICVVTGDVADLRSDVRQWSWTPPWTWLVFVLASPLVGVLCRIALRRRVTMELPFTDGAWRAWRRGVWLRRGAVTSAFVGVLGGVLLAGVETLGALTFLVCFGAAAAMLIVSVACPGPVLQEVTSDRILLRLPHPVVADAIQDRIDHGLRRFDRPRASELPASRRRAAAS
jgi:hypothetical protein